MGPVEAYATERPALVGVFADFQLQNGGQCSTAYQSNHPESGLFSEQLSVRFSWADRLLLVSIIYCLEEVHDEC